MDPSVLGKRAHKPSTKLTDSNNAASQELTFHEKVRADKAISELPVAHATPLTVAVPTASVPPSSAAFPPSSTTFPSSSAATPPPSPYVPHQSDSPPITPPPPLPKPKRIHVDSSPELQEVHQVHDSDDEAPIKPARRPAKRRQVESPELEPEDHALDVDEDPALEPTPTLKDRTRDIDAFFEKPFKTAAGKQKRQCITCKKKGLSTERSILVAESSTLRRHMEAVHKHQYELWCEKHKFESKLPKTVKARAEEKKNKDRTKQQGIDPHLREREKKKVIVPYSDELFRTAAIEWLIQTNQPIQALEHPAFKNMIDIASRATEGVIIPDRKATRRHIIELFKKNMTDLRKRLMSDKTGKVSMTCDAWQASNADAYFAVTGHWIEKTANGLEQFSALLGFTQMNTAHDGVRLGRALYKIVRRLGFGHKVGWVTCDNASNNITMLQHFGRLLNTSKTIASKKYWDWRSSHIRCLAHVINLSSQALIGTYSKAKHFDPQKPTEHEPDVEARVRDEVALVRAITARSSAKRKERLKNIQIKAGKSARVLLLDMKVRWSSTYIMLKRALELREFLDEFIYETGREETDFAKRSKIHALKLSEEEWQRAKLMVDLLEKADCAQQAFSYENTPTLQAGLPALEALHRAWSSRASREKYAPFSEALHTALRKIEEYYEKSATSHAYTFVMLLDPSSKLTHFKKNWSSELQQEVLESAEEIFKERYLELFGQEALSSRPAARTGNKKLAKLMEDSSDDEEDSAPVPTPTPTPAPDSGKPWLQEFNAYIHSAEESIGDISLPKWWGLNSSRFPVWSSLAQDYLAIMGSSVSSERAFSSAGITISKRRNRLKGDIVEALQFLKCFLRNELLFAEPQPCLIMEEELLPVDDDGDKDWADIDDPESWDSLVIDPDDTDDELN